MTCYENIPTELKKLNQWVCTRGDSKVPMKAWENEAASSVNPQTWADFDTAHKSVSEGHYDYCGFVFSRREAEARAARKSAQNKHGA